AQIAASDSRLSLIPWPKRTTTLTSATQSRSSLPSLPRKTKAIADSLLFFLSERRNHTQKKKKKKKDIRLHPLRMKKEMRRSRWRGKVISSMTTRSG
ncbi:unnamed protein product, partial [Linum tenue]